MLILIKEQHIIKGVNPKAQNYDKINFRNKTSKKEKSIVRYIPSFLPHHHLLHT